MAGYRSKVYKPIPFGKVQAKVTGHEIELSLGAQSKSFVVPDFMDFELVEGHLHFKSKDIGRCLRKSERALWGTIVSLIKSYILGLQKNHSKELFLRGPGYRATLKGRELVLNVGHSHEHIMQIPENDITVKIAVTKGNPREEKIAAQKIVIAGPDKQEVGDFSDAILRTRPYNVCSGNGILIVGKDMSFKRKSGASKK